MDEKKKKVMEVLLSFQTGRVEEWCEKWITSVPVKKSKYPPEGAPLIAKEKAKQEKLHYLEVYADKIISILN